MGRNETNKTRVEEEGNWDGKPIVDTETANGSTDGRKNAVTAEGKPTRHRYERITDQRMEEKTHSELTENQRDTVTTRWLEQKTEVEGTDFSGG